MFHLVFHVNDQTFTNEDEAVALAHNLGLSAIEWDEVDESGNIVNNGGRCTDDSCNCEKWWRD